jgi:hypothetical protein
MRTPRPTRSRIAVGAAALLLSLGAWLSGFSERGGPAAEQPEIRFPSHPREAEWERIAARQTLPVRPPPTGKPPDDEPEPLRDPFLRALPVGEGDPFVVMEANALRHSRLGERFVQCILAEDPEAFTEITRETGIDPRKDVDRVAFAGDAVVVSGFFDRVRWDLYEKETHARGVRYGDEATLWTTDGGANATASWRGQLLVTGPLADVQRAIDQVEGRAEPRRQDLADDLAYGELYGVLPGASALKLLPAGDGALAARLAVAAQRIELHVDAMDDVAGVIRVAGGPGQEVEDLARSLGAALSVARVKAAATDDRKLAALLENAQVVPGPAGFTVEVALPGSVLEEFFRDCGK